MKRSAGFAVIISVLLASSLGFAQEGSAIAPQGTPNSISDTGPHTRQPDLSLLAWLPWYYGVGIGLDARFEIPILPDGFIPNVNDDFTIEPSFGFAVATYFGYSVVDLTPAVYGIWGFHLSDRLRVYGGLGLGWDLWFANNGFNASASGATPFYWDLCLGLNYKFASNMAFRGEAGSQGLKAGLSIYF